MRTTELGRALQTWADETDLSQSATLSSRNVPLEPHAFYRSFGHLKHPRTKQPVEKLASYQYDIWKDGSKYRLICKSQKTGISTSLLLEDIQDALTWARGMEILIIAQDMPHAKDHLYTIRKLLSNSPRYKPYLIMKPDEFLFKDEITKANTVFIRNPDNPANPTRIIGLGSSEAAVWSWKNVAKIHMSDVAAIDTIDDAGLFNAAFSRLANTQGRLVIESPPRGQRGTVYEIYKQSQLREDAEEESPLSHFSVHEVPADMAVKEGLITQEFLDGEKIRMGPMYAQYYECKFLNSGNVWYDDELFEYEEDDLEVSL